MPIELESCGDCDPCVGGRPDQCAISPKPKPRFIPCDDVPEKDRSCETKWWYDTWRPLTQDESVESGGLRYVAVETYADKDPNNYRHIQPEMCLLFTDQQEYHVVCKDCRLVYGGMQWSGSTRGGPNWRQEAEDHRQEHQRVKGWCEFCDPIFGNGGWSIR